MKDIKSLPPDKLEVEFKKAMAEKKRKEEEEKCILKLPDGSVHSQSLELAVTEGQTQSPSHTKLSLPLPTITEHSGPAGQTGAQLRLSAKRKGRTRTESENEGSLDGSKSRLGLKSPLRECKMPRNQSAPHFVLANRNMSTVFTPISRVGSTVGYSIGSGSNLQTETPGGSGNLKCTNIIVRPLSRKDIFYSRSIYSIDDEPEESLKGGLKSNRQSYISMQSGLRSNKQSFVSIHRGSLVNSHLALPAIAEKEDKEVVLVDNNRGIMEVLKEMMNFSLLSNPLFLLIGISNAFGMIGFYTPFVYLPSMAATFDDISVEDAAFLVSIIGISNTVGRVISGWISDFSWVNSLVVTNMAIILSAITVFLFPRSR